jgi:hypothetical protein
MGKYVTIYRLEAPVQNPRESISGFFFVLVVKQMVRLKILSDELS